MSEANKRLDSVGTIVMGLGCLGLGFGLLGAHAWLIPGAILMGSSLIAWSIAVK
jgi:hypothetical protein